MCNDQELDWILDTHIESFLGMAINHNQSIMRDLYIYIYYNVRISPFCHGWPQTIYHILTQTHMYILLIIIPWKKENIVCVAQILWDFQGFPPLPPKKPGIEANPSIGFSCGLKGIEGPGALHEEGSVQCVPSLSQAKSWGCKREASKYRYKSLE